MGTMTSETKRAQAKASIRAYVSAYADDLERYGFRIMEDGKIFNVAKNRITGVVVTVKRGRAYYRSESGNLYASGVTPIEFVARFWYATTIDTTAEAIRNEP